MWLSIQNSWCLVSSVLYFHLVLYPKYLVLVLSALGLPLVLYPKYLVLVLSALGLLVALYPKYLVLVLSALGLLVALYPKYLVFGVLRSIFSSGSLSKISGVWCPPFYIFIWFSIQNIWCLVSSVLYFHLVLYPKYLVLVLSVLGLLVALYPKYLVLVLSVLGLLVVLYPKYLVLVLSALGLLVALYPKYLVFGVLRSIFSSGSLSKISGVWCPPFYIFIWFSIQNIWCFVSSVLYFHLVLYPKYLVFGVLRSIFSSGSLSKISSVWCPPFYIFIWFSIQNIWCLVSSVLYFHLVLYPKYLVFGVLRSIFSSGSLSKISSVWCPPFYIFIWFSIQNIWCLVSSVLYFHLVLYPKYLVLVLSVLGLPVVLYPKYLVLVLSVLYFIFIWFSIQNIWCWCSLF